MPFEFLPPSLIGLAQAGFAVFLLFGIGRLVPGTLHRPGFAILSGWGVVTLVLTGVGIVSDLNLYLPAAFLALVGLLGFVVKRSWQQDGLILVKTVGLMLPLLVVLAPALASQADIFLNLLPNAAYLVDYGQFPTKLRPDSFSFLPVAPYNTQFVPFLGSLGGGGLAANGLAETTVLLHGVGGMIMASLLVLGGNAAKSDRLPSLGMLALGLLFVTLLNPGFLPRVNLSGYGEMPIALCLLAAGFLWLEIDADIGRGAVWPRSFWPLVFTLIVLINIKQQSFGVFLAFLAGVGGTLVLGRGARVWHLGKILLAAAMPALLLYLAWRGFVAGEFPDGELRPLPFSAWQWGNLPQIFQSIGKVWLQKPWLYLGIVLAGLIAFVPAIGRSVQEETRHIALLLFGTAIAYNGFLLLTYIGHFPGQMSVEAHSYFRYTTHLSFLTMGVAALCARDWFITARPVKKTTLHSFGLPLAVLVMAIWPIAGQGYLRFDQDQPQPIVREIAGAFAPLLQPDERIGLVVPGDNGSVAAMLRGVLRYESPRKPRLQVVELSETRASDALKAATDLGLHRVLLTCSRQSGLDLPDGSAALLDRDEAGWHPSLIWLYEPFDPAIRWQAMLSSAPLCRS